MRCTALCCFKGRFGGLYKHCISGQGTTRKDDKIKFLAAVLLLFDPPHADSAADVQESLGLQQHGGAAAAAASGGYQGMTNGGNDSALIELAELHYIAGVLASLPYTVQSEPLYIIHTLAHGLALRGEVLLSRCRAVFAPIIQEDQDGANENSKAAIKTVDATSYAEVIFMCRAAEVLLLAAHLKACLHRIFPTCCLFTLLFDEDVV